MSLIKNYRQRLNEYGFDYNRVPLEVRLLAEVLSDELKATLGTQVAPSPSPAPGDTSARRGDPGFGCSDPGCC